MLVDLYLGKQMVLFLHWPVVVCIGVAYELFVLTYHYAFHGAFPYFFLDTQYNGALIAASYIGCLVLVVLFMLLLAVMLHQRDPHVAFSRPRVVILGSQDPDFDFGPPRDDGDTLEPVFEALQPRVPSTSRPPELIARTGYTPPFGPATTAHSGSVSPIISTRP